MSFIKAKPQQKRFSSFFSTMRSGINYFQQTAMKTISMKSKRRFSLRVATTSSDTQQIRQLRQQLDTSKQQCGRIKTQLSLQRQFEFDQFIYKSSKYQQLLQINDIKKKRLPTLNAKIGSVVKKSTIDHTNKNKIYLLKSTLINSQKWKPEPREGHTAIVYKNTIMVVGGHCNKSYDNTQIYHIDTKCWSKGICLSSARSYHTTVLYKSRYAIIFGGMGQYDMSRKCRLCFNSVNLLDLQTLSVRHLRMNGQQNVEGRRQHSCILMGKYMLVFGGINTKKDYLKDFYYLDLKELTWYQKEYRCEGRDLNEQMISGIAKHKAVGYFRNNHKVLPLYSSQYSELEGMYVFGGVFGSGQQNILLQMHFNSYNPMIRKVQYSGMPPSSINLNAEKYNENTIIVIAGQNRDRQFKIYKIKQREFVGIRNYEGSPYFGGVGSSISVAQSKIFVIFGFMEEGYTCEIGQLQIEQKVIQNEKKNIRERRQSIEQWKLWKREISSSQASNII